MVPVTLEEVTGPELTVERSTATGSSDRTLTLELAERAAIWLNIPPAGTPEGIGKGSEIDGGWKGAPRGTGIVEEAVVEEAVNVADPASGEKVYPVELPLHGLLREDPFVPGPGVGAPFSSVGSGSSAEPMTLPLCGSSEGDVPAGCVWRDVGSSAAALDAPR
jgi:hypothetical protein